MVSDRLLSASHPPLLFHPLPALLLLSWRGRHGYLHSSCPWPQLPQTHCHLLRLRLWCLPPRLSPHTWELSRHTLHRSSPLCLTPGPCLLLLPTEAFSLAAQTPVLHPQDWHAFSHALKVFMAWCIKPIFGCENRGQVCLHDLWKVTQWMKGKVCTLNNKL